MATRRSEIPGNQGLAALGVFAGEIDAANDPVAGMRAGGGPGVVEIRIEDVFAMLSRPQPVVDDELNNDVTGSGLAVGNVLAPARAPCPVPADAPARAAAIAAVMAHAAVGLVVAMIGRAFGHSRRKNERLQRPGRAEESNRFIQSLYPFLGPNAGMSGNEQVALVIGAQFFEISGVEGRVLPGQVHFSDHGVTGDRGIGSLGKLEGEKGDGEQESGRAHYNY